MSNREPTGLYVYQPKAPRADGRMYGVGGLPQGVTVEGLTRTEALMAANALALVWPTPKAELDHTGCNSIADRLRDLLREALNEWEVWESDQPVNAEHQMQRIAEIRAEAGLR